MFRSCQKLSHLMPTAIPKAAFRLNPWVASSPLECLKSLLLHECPRGKTMLHPPSPGQTLGTELLQEELSISR